MLKSLQAKLMKSIILFLRQDWGKRATERKTPWLTLMISLCSLQLLRSSDALMLLCFDRVAIAQGEWWRLIMGHFVHSSFDHWWWDALAFVCVGVYLEVRSRKYLIITLLLGLAAVNSLLLSPWSSLTYYCGLSGILFAPLTLALWWHWQSNRGFIGIAPLLLCVGKVIWECSLQSSLLVSSGWPAYPQSHLAGIVGGVLACLMFARYLRKQSASCSLA